jgi:outer membrane protein assembly factor BamB
MKLAVVLVVGALALMLGGEAAWGADAAALISRIGTPRGICVVLGDPRGTMALELARGSELTLFVQLMRDEDVAAARKNADDAGLLGTRIYVQKGSATHINLADDLADAVIVADAAAGVPREELMRVLRPQGKAITLTPRPTTSSRVPRSQRERERTAGETELVKPYARGTDEWTHPYHGPDNNPMSNDQVARRPYLTHFMVEPWYCPLQQMTVISGGRMFKTFGDRSSARPQEGLLNKLLAMSAFNGTILWQRDLSPGFMAHRNTLVATPDTLFLADDKSCQLIDAATGKVKREIVVPEGLSDGPVWKWMAVEGGVLYALVGASEKADEPLRGDRIRGAGWPWWKINEYTFGFGRTLLAIDPQSGRVLWSRREEERIDGRAVCLKGGRIYYYCDGKFLACVEASTGSVIWKNSDADLLEAIGPAGPAQNPLYGFASTAYMKCGDDALFFAGPQRPRLVGASTRDGKLLWQHKGGNAQLVLRSDGVYALGEGRIQSANSSMKLDPVSGEILAQFPSRDRCTRATGCFDSIFTRGGAGGSTSVFDVTSAEPKLGVVTPMRPACTDGVVVAHGYLFWGPWMCRCDLTQLGVISLGHGGSFDYTAAASNAERLESSANAARVAALAVTADDWPAFRKDNHRSTFTNQTTAAQVAQKWEYKPPHTVIPTAPVAAAGLVLVTGADGIVRGLDGQSGQLRWSAYTGAGSIKYPPAIADGRAYVGGGDGWVYALEASTGRQLWRFRAAPTERTIPLYGSLTSTWPVGSGVLVDQGVVYAASGISNFDGTHVFALDATSGQIRWQNHTSGNGGSDLPDGGVSVQGHLLLHDGAVYMAGGNQLGTPQRPNAAVKTSVAEFLASRVQRSVASYAVSDGVFTAAGTGRGKDLFVRNGKVQATGFPLYWRPEDDHFLSTMELETPSGVIAITTSPNPPQNSSLSRLAEAVDPAQKPAALWTDKSCQEIAGLVVTKNAVVVSGVNRSPRQPNEAQPMLYALDVATGSPIWKQDLPAAPVAWGLAVDRSGQIIVTLIDGRVVCFAGS